MKIFIAKPVNKLELVTRVRSFLELRIGQQQSDRLGPEWQPRASDVVGLTDEGDQIEPPPAEDVDAMSESQE